MRIALTANNFDILDERDHHLLFQMRKSVVPNGNVVVFLFDDYEIFKDQDCFPVQNYATRRENLSYLADHIFNISDDPVKTIRNYILKNYDKESDKITYFAYDDYKDFAWRPVLKELGIPIKFIKWKNQE